MFLNINCNISKSRLIIINKTRNLAIANRSHVSCAHNTSTASNAIYSNYVIWVKLLTMVTLTVDTQRLKIAYVFVS